MVRELVGAADRVKVVADQVGEEGDLESWEDAPIMPVLASASYGRHLQVCILASNFVWRSNAWSLQFALNRLGYKSRFVLCCRRDLLLPSTIRICDLAPCLESLPGVGSCG